MWFIWCYHHTTDEHLGRSIEIFILKDKYYIFYSNFHRVSRVYIPWSNIAGWLGKMNFKITPNGMHKSSELWGFLQLRTQVPTERSDEDICFLGFVLLCTRCWLFSGGNWNWLGQHGRWIWSRKTSRVSWIKKNNYKWWLK